MYGPNVQDLIQIVNNLNKRDIGFHSLQENITIKYPNFNCYS